MIVYLDSSFVIRRLLGVGKPAEFWGKWEKAYASTLMRTECYRIANNLRLAGKLDDAGRARLGAWIEMVCSAVTQIPLTDNVMKRAAEACEDCAVVEKPAKLEGRQMLMFLAPKGTK